MNTSGSSLLTMLSEERIVTCGYCDTAVSDPGLSRDELREHLKAEGWLLLPPIPESRIAAVCPQCRPHMINGITEKGAELLQMEYLSRTKTHTRRRQ